MPHEKSLFRFGCERLFQTIQPLMKTEKNSVIGWLHLLMIRVESGFALQWWNFQIGRKELLS